MNSKEPTKLLWTGGWDSTFRLLQILLEEKKKVQPIYMIDPARNSTGIEIQSMDKLKRIIHQKYPETEILLSHVYYVNIESLEPDEEITNAYKTLKQYVPLGNQYEWLPRFCKQNNYHEVEFAIENVADGLGRSEGSKFVRQFISDNFSADPNKLSKKERLIYSTSKTLLQYFKFPVIHISKSEMLRLGMQNGWMPIMEKTWFCYQPLNVPFRGLSPCGNCITCRLQTQGGLKWRIPWYVKFFQKTRMFKNKLTGVSN